MRSSYKAVRRLCSVTIKHETDFSAAHLLSDIFEEGHKCSNLHGHNWKVITKVKANFGQDSNPKTIPDVILDFCLIKKTIHRLDHKLIIEVKKLLEVQRALKEPYLQAAEVAGPSIAENIAYQFAQEVGDLLEWRFNVDDPPIEGISSFDVEVTVYESERNSATAKMMVAVVPTTDSSDGN